MRLQGRALLTAVLLWGGFSGRAQEVSHTATPTVIRSETRLVLVDAVVTDKKGNYVPDLAQKNFKVYEDNKEQSITSFSYEADPASPNNNQKHYLVLFFDNASVAIGDQMKAREAAQKFVDSNTGPNKFIAVVNFSGSMRVTQNFTNDADRLKQVLSGVKFSTVSTADDSGSRGLNGTATLSQAATFGVNSVLLGMRSLAKGLADVPGRKMLVMLTAGFVLNDETRPEMVATIAACNKSNVSVYPIDVRGLTTGPDIMPADRPGGFPGGRGGRNEDPPMAFLGPSRGIFQGASSLSLASFGFQARGGGGVGSGSSGAGAGTGAGAGSTAAGAGAGAGARGGTASGAGATTGGTVGGARGGTTGTTGTAPGTVGNRGNPSPGGTIPGRGGATNPINPALMNRNPMNDPRSIFLNRPPSVDPRDALYQLAEGTGGFVITNTNDLLGGMEKIAREQSQYYVIGFSPAESAEGSCHTLHLKLDKGGTNVRSRSGYCNVRQVDVLAGKPAETELESLAVGQSKGKLGSPLQIPFFYSSPNVARVNVSMEIPSDSFKFEKVKGKFHAEMNLLGIAYRPDGGVGAKFSDNLKYDFDNKTQVEEFGRKPVHYENQFDIATGQYNFKVVFSAGGENFGKIEKPLAIEPFDGKQFALSALALSKELVKTQGDTGMESVLIEDRVPLVALGIQAIPAAQYSFKANEPAGVYLEVYDPGLTEEKPPELAISLRLVDRKTGAQKLASGNLTLAKYVRSGNPLVPVVLLLPIKDLPEGGYRVDVTGLDSTGKSVTRSADFDVEPATAPVLGWDKK
jgi:VWFA-related protein